MFGVSQMRTMSLSDTLLSLLCGHTVALTFGRTLISLALNPLHGLFMRGKGSNATLTITEYIKNSPGQKHK